MSLEPAESIVVAQDEAMTIEKQLANIQGALDTLSSKVDGFGGQYVSRVEADERESVMKAYFDRRVDEIEKDNQRIDGMLGEIKGAFKGLVESVNLVSKNIADWGADVRTFSEMEKRNDRRLTSAFGEINKLDDWMGMISVDNQKLTMAVFGVAVENGPDSLFRMMKTLQTDTANSLRRIEEQIVMSATEIGKNTALRLQLEKRALKWRERREKFGALAVQLGIGNPFMWKVIGTAALAALAGLGIIELT
jgi:hypothetical protein